MPEGNLVTLRFRTDSAGAIKGIEAVSDASGRAAAKIKLDSDEIERANEKSSGSFDRVHESTGRVHAGLALLAGSVGLGAMTYGLTGATRAAMGLQEQQAQLQASLKNTGAYSQAAFGQLTAASEQAASSGGFGVQENVQSLTQLTRVTGNATAATKLFALATNVARGSHKDLLQVTKALALAEQGRTTGLSRMGIVLPKGATPQQAMALLQQRFGGATAAFSKTAAGSMSNLAQGWDVLKEDLGKAFLPLTSTLANTLTKAMPGISRLMNSIAQPLAATLQKLLPPLMTGLQTLLPPILGVVRTVLPPILQALNSVLPTLATNLKTLLPVFQKALDTILPPLVHLFNVVMPLVTKMASEILPPLIRIFSSVLPVITRAIETIAPPFMKALGMVITALAPVIGKMVQTLAPIFPVLANAIATLMPPLAKALVAVMPALTNAISVLLPPFVKAFDTLVPPLTAALVKLMPAISLLANVVSAVLGVFGSSPSTRTLHNAAVTRGFGTGRPGDAAALGTLHRHPALLSSRSTGRAANASTIGPVHRSSYTPPPVSHTSSSASGSQNSINASSHPASTGIEHHEATAPIVIKVGDRVLTETVAHFALRRAALS